MPRLPALERALQAQYGGVEIIRRIENQRRRFGRIVFGEARCYRARFETADIADQIIDIILLEADVEKGLHRGTGQSEHNGLADHLVGGRSEEARVGYRRRHGCELALARIGDAGAESLAAAIGGVAAAAVHLVNRLTAHRIAVDVRILARIDARG